MDRVYKFLKKLESEDIIMNEVVTEIAIKGHIVWGQTRAKRA